MTKKTKNYICSGIQKNTLGNLGKVLKLLTEITHDEHYYNYEISDATHEMRMEIIEIYHQVRKVITK